MGEAFKKMISLRKAACRAVAQRRWKQGIKESEALKSGMKAKRKEFVEKGLEVYAKT